MIYKEKDILSMISKKDIDIFKKYVESFFEKIFNVDFRRKINLFVSHPAQGFQRDMYYDTNSYSDTLITLHSNNEIITKCIDKDFIYVDHELFKTTAQLYTNRFHAIPIYKVFNLGHDSDELGSFNPKLVCETLEKYFSYKSSVSDVKSISNENMPNR